ncbi:MULTISPECIES: ImmA/IrrE family metallo-endopeptidase [unclassified Curtobacterium]|uniref:ImmA/IrrE family metallo-endopeptidase n=1 Tax=unclassified Curtobacterium TaxID=257496 RepID=UPI0011B63F8B|nr:MULTISPECIES: hypothetical protein [unclassified Curtobacterium]
MNSFEVCIDWLDAAGVRTPELAATWASLSMRIGNEPVTLVRDTLANSYRDSIHVSAYPLAEWIAYNWWLLTTPGSTAQVDFLNAAQRPSLDMRAAGDGFAWPPIRLFPEQGYYFITSRPEESADQRIIYQQRSSWVTDFDDTVTGLFGFVASVITRLEQENIFDTPLQREWSRVENMSEDELEFCRVAAAFGLDPYSAGPLESQGLIDAAAKVGNVDLLAEVVPVTPRDGLQYSADWLAESLQELNELETSETGRVVEKIASAVSARHLRQQARSLEHPWTIGFSRARAARDVLGLKSSDAAPVETYISTAYSKLPSPIHAPALVTPSTPSPRAVVGPSRGVSSTRFLQARVLSRAVYQSDERVHVMTDGPFISDRIERAFAAEFLAPAIGISTLLAGDFSDRACQGVADHFGVDRRVIEHQIDNQIRADFS